MKNKSEKDYRCPRTMLSLTIDERKIVTILKDKYYINISKFAREKFLELYNQLEKNNATNKII